MLVPLEDLNSSYHNKVVVCQGIVSELSAEFEDKDYGFIQLAHIQSLRKNNQEINVQREKIVILPEEFIDLISLGDRVQITGVLSVYNVDKTTLSDLVILTKELRILDDNRYHFSGQEIIKFNTIAKESLIQKKLADYIFNNVLLEDDIKLLGALILFCAESPKLVKVGIHCNVSLLIVGPSKTYKSTYLQRIKELLPNQSFQFSQKSDAKFITYNSRYKKGGHYCKKAGLADFAKKGIILIDNLETLKESRLSNLDRNFIQILRKSSIISAAHVKGREYYDRMSVYENLRFPKKNNLLGKFDIVLVSSDRPDYKIENSEIIKGMKEKIEHNPLFSKDLLRKYIIYAKKEYDPMLTKEAVDIITKFKRDMLRINKENEKIRELDLCNLTRVLIALSKAHARMALKNEIDVADVQNIIRIYRESMANLDLI